MEYFKKLLEISEKCECGTLYISKDAHKTDYASIEGYLTDRALMPKEDMEEWNSIIERCVQSGEIWEVILYLDTPIGQYCAYDSSLENACKRICESLNG